MPVAVPKTIGAAGGAGEAAAGASATSVVRLATRGELVQW
jgi:hypothetical protein